MKKIYVCFKFTLVVLGLSAFIFSQTQLEGHWKISDRSPASIENILKDRDPSLYGDYFSYGHKMSVEFWTNKDEDSIKKRARLALHMAISKTLSSGFSKELFKKNLIKSFSGNFIKSLYLLKIMNGTFQIDLNFSPDQMNSFSKLMDSNQLVDSAETGELLKSLLEEEDHFETILLNRSYKTEKDYSNLGGTITFWFTILDLNWNPLDPIPNPPANAVKGFIKYRRYYRMNDKLEPLILSSTKKFKLNGRWKKENSPKILTVDVTKEFNLKHLIPKSKKIEIFFGKIKAPKYYKTGQLGHLNLFSKDSQPNKFLLFGSNTEQYYEFELKKLEFNLEKNKFSHSSKIKTSGNWDGFNLGQKRKFKREVRHSLLGEDAISLIKSLKLYRFHKNFKEVGGP